MTDAQKKLVQDSFAKVAPIADKAAEIFYSNLFTLDSSLKPLFAKSDMKEQGKKLMQMIGTAVAGLDNLEALIPAVQDLGKRHVGYGVPKSSYDTVGQALLQTLATGLGDDFTPETKEAWTITYTTLANVMIEASEYDKVEEEKEELVTAEEKKLVQESFDKVAPIADKAAEIFYGKLFELDPALKTLFANSDMSQQGKKLMAMIGTAVAGLNDLEKLVPAVQDLGKRHIGYNVPKSSYETVGAALLDTLAVGLGDEFTPETKAAWAKVYGILSSVMIEASEYDKNPVPEPTIEEEKEELVTAEEKKLVQESFAKVAPIADKAAEIFYGKLFELNPALKTLFANSDMSQQGKKLMAMIGTAVSGLDDLGSLVPAVQDLGKRHMGYNVPASSYETVGAALLDTLAVGLGDEFTPETKAAWAKVYGILSSVMIEASEYDKNPVPEPELPKEEPTSEGLLGKIKSMFK